MVCITHLIHNKRRKIRLFHILYCFGSHFFRMIDENRHAYPHPHIHRMRWQWPEKWSFRSVTDFIDKFVLLVNECCGLYLEIVCLIEIEHKK